MTTCANDHPPIQHDEFWCPLCAALEDTRGYEAALDQAEGTIADLEEHIDALDLADVLHAQAAQAEAEARAWKAEQRYTRLVYEIGMSERERTLTRKLARIHKAAREAATA